MSRTLGYGIEKASWTPSGWFIHTADRPIPVRKTDTSTGTRIGCLGVSFDGYGCLSGLMPSCWTQKA